MNMFVSLKYPWGTGYQLTCFSFPINLIGLGSEQMDCRWSEVDVYVYTYVYAYVVA